MDYYSPELASPWRRLLASGIDLLALAVCLLAFVGSDHRVVEGVVGRQGSQVVLAVAVVALSATIFTQGYLLYADRQTIGKRLLGLRIEVTEEASILASMTSGGRIRLGGSDPFPVPAMGRYVPFLLSGFVLAPFAPLWIGPVWILIVVPMFGSGRRGLHDYFGGSRVVDGSDD